MFSCTRVMTVAITGRSVLAGCQAEVGTSIPWGGLHVHVHYHPFPYRGSPSQWQADIFILTQRPHRETT